MDSLKTALAAIAMCGTVGVAHAGTITSQTFDTDPVLGSSAAPGVWYTDRYAPAEFQSTNFMGDNRLEIAISESDGAANRPSGYSSGFYNTQGRKYDTAGATSVSIDLYVDSAWENLSERITGIWGTAFSGGTISYYPIIEFQNGGFSIWDGAGFVNAAASFAYDSFVTLGMELNGSNMDYFVNGSLVASLDSNGSASIENVILQAYNTDAGVNRSVYYDNLTASQVPVPAALPLLASALGVAGFVGRRRKRAA